MFKQPQTSNKFVAVCGSQEERHGIVLAKINAKMMGVQTGRQYGRQNKMPRFGNCSAYFDEYLKYSRLVREVYYQYTDLIEPFGMDECWLDVTGSTGLFGDGSQIAHKIRECVKKEIDLRFRRSIF